MIPSAFVYFCLLCVTWISCVRALTPAQRTEIDLFVTYIGPGLFNAFGAITTPTLDAYFRDSIKDFATALGPFYLDRLKRAVFVGKDPAPMPSSDVFPASLDSDGDRELAGLTNFVNLIKYYNISLLNKLKLNMISTYGSDARLGPQTILGIINPSYVESLWNEYEASRTGATLSFRYYIIHIATLYSINATVLGLIRQNDLVLGSQVQRLAVYQDMISDLHFAMARYLKISSLVPFSSSFKSSEQRLNQITSIVDAPKRMSRIRTFAYDLSTEILSVISIYGITPKPPIPFKPEKFAIPGTATILRLFETDWAIRRLIGHHINMTVPDDVWMARALRTLRAELEGKIDKVLWIHLNGPGSEWVSRLLPMVNTVLDVLNWQARAGRYYPPPRAGPSGRSYLPPPGGLSGSDYPPPPGRHLARIE
jgi:hypothetical protein